MNEKLYRIRCHTGYAILGEAPPKMDQTATYRLLGESIIRTALLQKDTIEKSIVGIAHGSFIKVLCYQNENKIIGERKIDTSKNTLV